MNIQTELDKLKRMTALQRDELSYDYLNELLDNASEEEKIELANVFGYPIFTRMCMNQIRHKFILLQDGAAMIIVNPQGQILLQRRSDNNKWGLPGGCQNLGETFIDTAIREVKEETSLEVESKDVKLVDIVSGKCRRNSYPNGDVVFNNTVLYMTDKYSGNLKMDEESKELRFFSLEEIPENLHDKDLIELWKKKQ